MDNIIITKENYEEYLSKIKDANKAYEDGDPIITDKEFDILNKKISDYETTNNIKNGFSSQIGSQATYKKQEHLTKMYSIKDCFTYEDLDKFLDSYDGEEIYLEYKFDGASLNLIYENGKLVKMLTRGDGIVGDDISFNIPYIENILTEIPYKEKIEIRGEALIRNSDFYNEVKELYPELSNPRNTVSGSLRLLDPEIIKNRKIVFQPYGIGYDYKDFKTQKEIMDFIYGLGFKNLFGGPNGVIAPYPGNKDFVKINVKKYLENTLENIKNEKYEIELDGVVIRCNRLEICNEFNNKYPKFILAYKFPHSEYITRLLDVEYTVGRTGKITPIGIIEPVNINGVTVRKVTLHNYGEIKQKGLMLLDVIGIIRSGEVIPKLTTVFKNRRDGKEKEIELPDNCPCCFTELKRVGPDMYCVGNTCRDRDVAKISYFVNRDNFNIVGLGEMSIDRLIAYRMIKDIDDIFDLTEDNLIKAFGEVLGKKLKNNIEKSKTVTTDRFISSLGIPGISNTMSKIIADYSKSLNKSPFKLTVKEIKDIPNIGPVAKESFINYIDQNNFKIQNIEKKITIKDDLILTQKLKGKMFCITGALSVSRNIIENKILNNGGSLISMPNKDTIIITNETESTNNKFVKGKALGCTFITEEEFNKMI